MLAKKFPMVPCLLSAALGLAFVTGHAQSAGSATTDSVGKAALPNDRPPMVVLVPVQDNPDPKLYNGCWVRLLDNIEKPKGNDYLTIVGSMYLPSLRTPSGVDWTRKADGLNIGPKALVTVYGEKAYRGPGVVLKPNQVIQDLRKELGFVNSVESMKVDCNAG